MIPAGLPEIFVSLTDREIPERVVCFRDMTQKPLLRRELRGDERAALEQRAAHLRLALQACADDEHVDAAAAVSGMLAGFGSIGRYDGNTAKVITAAYVETVKERPLWAIERMCMDIRRGRAGLKPNYCPNEPELNVLIGHKIAPYRARLMAVEALLCARVDR